MICKMFRYVSLGEICESVKRIFKNAEVIISYSYLENIVMKQLIVQLYIIIHNYMLSRVTTEIQGVKYILKI